MLDYFSTAPERPRIGASRPQTDPDPEGTLSWYMAIITPSRHMETLMLAIVRNVRRRLRQQFFRTRGRNRSMRVLPVYEFPGPRVLALARARCRHIRDRAGEGRQ